MKPLNGTPAPAPSPPAPKPSRKKRPKKFLVLEIITEIESYSKEAAEKFVAGVCPRNRTFVVKAKP